MGNHLAEHNVAIYAVKIKLPGHRNICSFAFSGVSFELLITKRIKENLKVFKKKMEETKKQLAGNQELSKRSRLCRCAAGKNAKLL